MLLLQDLRSGRIPITSEMEPWDVYLQRLEFAEFDGNYKNFPGHLRDARKQIICKNSRSALDSAALAHDCEIYPKAAYNHRGEPRWEWSEAEWLLRQDMDEGKHKTMKLQIVYQLREESITKTTHSKLFGSISIKKKSIANSTHSTTALTTTSTTCKLLWTSMLLD